MRRWYAVHTQPQAEGKAEFNLRRQGFEVYCPRLQKQRRHARRINTVLVPLFPRYLFTALDVDEQPWRAINGTFGVVHLVGCGERPTPVPEGLVEAIAMREGEAGCVTLPPPSFQPGDLLVLEDGPFKDLVGRFECMSDAERVTVLLDLMGREVRVATHYTAIRRAG
jgi:transcriptional antiterminator RfaH